MFEILLILNLLIPLEISKKPAIKGILAFSEMFNKDNNFPNILNICKFSKIEIITENKTTKPPMFKIVLIDFLILIQQYC